MRTTLIVFTIILFQSSCAEQTPVVAPSDTLPAQIVQIDGSIYRFAAKASATAQSDLSIELSYVIRGGQAHIDAVTIDGLEYRANCSSGAAQERGDVGSSAGAVPHHQYCEDGVGVRDIDFTCGGLRNPPPPQEEPGPETVRLKVEGNEEYLRSRFERAIRAGGGWGLYPKANRTPIIPRCPPLILHTI